MLTPYVDGELTTGERRRVEDHLARCERCRNRVGRERAVAQRLRRWSAEMRAAGVGLPSEMVMATAPPRPVGSMPRTAMAVLVVVALVAVVWSSWPSRAGAAFAARGLITDSRCARGHTPAPGTISRGDCVRRCVEMGAHYVFVSQGVIYAIRNQDFRDLSDLAGEEVQLEGKLQQQVLTVSQVRPAAGHRSSNEWFWRKVRVS
jgi:hypothetical protein